MILRALRQRLVALGLIVCISPAAAQTTEATLPETIVSGTREPEPRSATPIAATRIDGTTIEEVRPAHPSEILNRVPGVIVTQTNGEGSIVGIRQPFGTAPLNLYLQDNVPVQPTGYFNHNALYLTDIPQAGAVEVIRGPGTSLQGSDAIGGVVNTLTAAPTAGASRGPSARMKPKASRRPRLVSQASTGCIRGSARSCRTPGAIPADAARRRSHPAWRGCRSPG